MCLDMEHSSMGLDTIAHNIRAAQAAMCPPVVRVPGHGPGDPDLKVIAPRTIAQEACIASCLSAQARSDETMPLSWSAATRSADGHTLAQEIMRVLDLGASAIIVPGALSKKSLSPCPPMRMGARAALRAVFQGQRLVTGGCLGMVWGAKGTWRPCSRRALSPSPGRRLVLCRPRVACEARIRLYEPVATGL